MAKSSEAKKRKKTIKGIKGTPSEKKRERKGKVTKRELEKDLAKRRKESREREAFWTDINRQGQPKAALGPDPEANPKDDLQDLAATIETGEDVKRRRERRPSKKAYGGMVQTGTPDKDKIMGASSMQQNPQQSLMEMNRNKVTGMAKGGKVYCKGGGTRKVRT